MTIKKKKKNSMEKLDFDNVLWLNYSFLESNISLNLIRLIISTSIYSMCIYKYIYIMFFYPNQII